MHDCTAGCGVPGNDRRICSGFYEDPAAKVSSHLTQQDLCRSYGCCYAQMSDEEVYKQPRCRGHLLIATAYFAVWLAQLFEKKLMRPHRAPHPTLRILSANGYCRVMQTMGQSSTWLQRTDDEAAHQ